ncbi:hypothetical protein C900_05512 [Fulvivirga imtechensis AK7]|uniref:Uncharacterized protein n=1 Tax=Fulvivirga imtechensis AK7 TaxID=1237149 RepID=L8JNS4_9BACT|nr:hypothetical protein C900_05512 [Fulvivirga imtechensis AK7]
MGHFSTTLFFGNAKIGINSRFFDWYDILIGDSKPNHRQNETAGITYQSSRIHHAYRVVYYEFPHQLRKNKH